MVRLCMNFRCCPLSRTYFHEGDVWSSRPRFLPPQLCSFPTWASDYGNRHQFDFLEKTRPPVLTISLQWRLQIDRWAMAFQQWIFHCSSLWETDAVFLDVLCPRQLHALRQERKQKLVPEGTVLHTEDRLLILDMASM